MSRLVASQDAGHCPCAGADVRDNGRAGVTPDAPIQSEERRQSAFQFISQRGVIRLDYRQFLDRAPCHDQINQSIHRLAGRSHIGHRTHVALHNLDHRANPEQCPNQGLRIADAAAAVVGDTALAARSR